MENLPDIAVFVRVVDTGSFTAAAEALGISQPVVSKSVARLEERLGARLLNRTTRRLSLTEAGAELYRRSQHALKQIEDAELEVARYQTEPRGSLRASAPMSFGILHLAPVLHEFLDRFPGVSVDMSFDDRFVDIVEEGLDLAVRIGRLQDSALIARRIAPIRQAICASPAYFARHGVPRTPEDLLNHNCLLYSFGSTPRAWRLVAADGSDYIMPVRGTVSMNNGLAERALALSGAGLIILPTFYVGDDLRAGRLKAVLCEWAPRDLSLHAVYPERRNLSPKVRAFVDFLAMKFGPEPYWDDTLDDVKGGVGAAAC
ncbi:MAG TPA: LysR family transcriptional regulator [Steroidobacteraceae bacterium]|nr:LysR family transcriptional regulator [Steroidobacteraceae bacterium]